ncbi:hypothetical protein ACH5RR_034838 [Cinchona calisaya]|uniref:Rapid ALkalinization Factor n=1 Tax=Cinchona calisaya TaxID=153742 RepID=A0ABD2YF52_9GENT
MGISLNNISWLLTLIIITIIVIQNASCVSTENIPFPSGGGGWGNNWTAEYVTDSDEELFLKESHNQYYNNILASQSIGYGPLRRKPICNNDRYRDCIQPNQGGGKNPCGFEQRRCKAVGS